MKTKLFNSDLWSPVIQGNYILCQLLHPIISKQFHVYEHPEVRYTNSLFIEETVHNSGIFRGWGRAVNHKIQN